MKILSKPNGNAREYGRWAVNAYLGCPNQCQYCYLQTGPSAKTLGGHEARLKAGIINEEHAYHIAMTEIIEHRDEIIRDGGLFFTFTSDPCLPETCDLTFTIAHEAIAMGIPVMLLTKDATFHNLDDFEEKTLGYGKEENWRRMVFFSHVATKRLDFIRNQNFHYPKDNIAFGWTLTGHDELEPNTSPNSERINAMRSIAERGFYTWASIEPVVTFTSSLDMIRQALDAGCQHFKIGLMTSRTKVCRHGFSLGGRDFKPYDPAECLAFVQDVMQLTRDRATVYWKQSFRDFVDGTPAHRLFNDDALHKIFDDYPNAVGAQWNMFNDNK